jgi:hypothetical protein
MLSQQNKAGQDGSPALSDSKVNEEVLSSFLVAPKYGEVTGSL